MKKYYLLLVFLIGLGASAQKSMRPLSTKITYLRTSNAKLVENQDPIIVYAHAGGSLIVSEKIIAGKAKIPYEKISVDIANGQITQTGQIGADELVQTIDSTSLGKQTWELTAETKKILGYNCKKAKTVINSNWIDIWYTNELGVHGGPSVLGQKLGLVLETVRNGNFAVTATKIEKAKGPPAATLLKPGQFAVDALTYKDALWRSRFTKIEIFSNEAVNFSDDTLADANTVRLSKGNVVLRKVKIPQIAKQSQVFLDVTEKSRGDAYDRTGLIFAIPADDAAAFIAALKKGGQNLPAPARKSEGFVHDANQPPQLELMRFFTPFGVSQYNYLKLKNKTWQDSVIYRQDISDVAQAISGREVIIGVNIGNYDKGGHSVSANITIHQEDGPPHGPEKVILPLFNTTNVLQNNPADHNALLKTEKGYATTFTTAQPLKNARLRYITTGHGGWENGDEFLQKRNTVLLDTKEVYSFVPWRTDCGSYRLSNPASGNFENGLSSSDYSRSNWCPGTTTNPVWIELGDLAAGEHTIRVNIPVGEPEGGSTSSWIVSGVLIGEKYGK